MPLQLIHRKTRVTLVPRQNVKGLPSYKSDFCVVFHDGVDWVVSGIGRSINSNALHPNSVHKEEWWPPSLEVRFVMDPKPTRRDPVCLEKDIGVDFFVRSCRSSKPFWYRSPSGKITHSGAKRNEDLPGTRWCNQCRRDISANNWKSQHMRLKHTDDEWHLFCKFIDECLR